ncbi:MAG TPA: ester cyclase [Chitinophagales bacterium]|nr:ester cyclase [Chitinophagales bacterium]
MKTPSLLLIFTALIFFVIASCNDNGTMKKENNTLEKNKALVQRLDDAFDAGDTTIVDSLLSDDAVDHSPPPGMTGSSKEILRKIISSFHTAFPNGKSTITATVAEGDWVMQYGTFKGTNSGSFMGMPVSNKEMSFDFSDALKFKDGKITDHWGIIDMATMMQQMGMMPPQASSGDSSMMKKDSPM